MAEYIMTILRSELMVVFSWGFHNPVALPNNKGLRFQVQGFKYQGGVEVIYNESRDLFEVILIGTGVIVKDVYIDCLTNLIDVLVERCDNYKERVEDKYQFSLL